MRETTEILIIGGGPGGLACATLLAQHGIKVVLVERKAMIGPKVCAGGITWNGLLKFTPPTLIEQEFPEQHIITRWQRIVVAEHNPIIATVSRERLGQWMAEQAKEAGVTLLTNTRALSLGKNTAVLETGGNRRVKICFDHLVGADGSNSLVRRFLGLPSSAMGIGLNCMVPGRYQQMEWHLHTGRFGYGYGWIFPHAEVVSIGAYGDVNNLSAQILKKRLLHWAGNRGFSLNPDTIRAGLVNFDYRGVRFDHTWLVGDAAGLASGLTGEGIYPALISGQAVARMILDPGYAATELTGLVKKHRRHRQIIALARKQHHLCSLFMEALVVLLRLKILDFHALEMAE
jgi:flavin-dependent dehydrogenase